MTRYDTVLMLMEGTTRKPRFVFKRQDWKQTRSTQDAMAAEGIPVLLEEVFRGPSADCDQFVAGKVAELEAEGVSVGFATTPGQPSPPKAGRRVKHEITGMVYPSVAQAARELEVPFSRARRSAEGFRVADRVPIHYI